MLEVEIPNAREANLNRVMYFGHTWSPTLELATQPELLHGHAISVDMGYSATLSMLMGHLPAASHARLLALFSNLGLALDHPSFTLDLLKEATTATIATRNGELRAPLPTGALGTHVIIANIEWPVLAKAWEMHKEFVKSLPRGGLGVEATIDIRVGAGTSATVMDGNTKVETGKVATCTCKHAMPTIQAVAVAEQVATKVYEPVIAEVDEDNTVHVARGMGWYGDCH